MIERINANTLILTGALDERTNPTQAFDLAVRIIASGGSATVKIFPDAGHDIPSADREAMTAAFVRTALRRQVWTNLDNVSLTRASPELIEKRRPKQADLLMPAEVIRRWSELTSASSRPIVWRGCIHEA